MTKLQTKTNSDRWRVKTVLVKESFILHKCKNLDADGDLWIFFGYRMNGQRLTADEIAEIRRELLGHFKSRFLGRIF